MKKSTGFCWAAVIALLAASSHAWATVTPLQYKSRTIASHVDGNDVYRSMGDFLTIEEGGVIGEGGMSSVFPIPGDPIHGPLLNESEAVSSTSVISSGNSSILWEIKNNVIGEFSGRNKQTLTFDITNTNESFTLTGIITAIADTRFEDSANGSFVSQVTTLTLTRRGSGTVYVDEVASASASAGTRQISKTTIDQGVTLPTGRYDLIFDTQITMTVDAAPFVTPTPYIEAGIDTAVNPNWPTWSLTVDGLPPTNPEPGASVLMLVGGVLCLARRRTTR